MAIKNICVLGGSGFIGKHLVHLLHASGFTVRVPTRNREHARELLVLPTVDVVEADIHDSLELERQFDGMDAVINLVGILHEATPGRVDKPSARRGSFHQHHIELPRKIVHACSKQGVRRLLHMSALNADPTAQSAYLRSKGLGETIVREAGMAHSTHENWYLDGPKFVHGYGLATTVFRPSVVFGREDTFLNLFARLLKLFPLLPLGSPNAKFQPVYVEDVARAFVVCLNNPATFGQRYDLCGPKIYTLQQLVEFVAHTKGYHRRIIPLCDRLSYLQAMMLEFLPGKLITRDNYYSMKVDSICHCEFPPVFGFQPEALEAAAPSYLAGDTPRARYDGFRNSARR